MENNEQLLKYDENIGLYDHINPILNLKDLNRKQVKELAKEIANNKSQTHSWQEVLNNAVNYDSKNKGQEKRFKRIFNKQLNENLAPTLEKQHKQELIDRMKSGDTSAMSQWTAEGINKFGHQFMPVMLTAATLPFGVSAVGQAVNTIGLLPVLGAEAGSWGLGYGGYKLGSKLDDDFGTNWIAPALSVASGIGGYGTGYKGMVKLGSRGWLPKGDRFMCGKQFVGDVAADAMNRNMYPITKFNKAVLQNRINAYTSDRFMRDPVTKTWSRNLYTDGSASTKQPSTAPWNVIDIERRKQIERHNAFARKYNEGFGEGLLPYEIVPDDITDEALNEATKNMLRQHNTFYRGVTYSPEIEQLAKSKNISLDEALKIAAHRPKTYNGYTWVSPYLSAGYGGNRGHIPGVAGVARLERPYRLGPDRTKWFDEADFNLGVRTDQGEAEIFNPWIEKPGSTIGSELLGRRFIFRDWVSDYPLLSYGSRKR